MICDFRPDVICDSGLMVPLCSQSSLVEYWHLLGTSTSTVQGPLYYCCTGLLLKWMIVSIVLLILVKVHVVLQMFHFSTDIRKLFITFCNFHNFCIEPYVLREPRRGPSNRMLYVQNSDCQRVPSRCKQSRKAGSMNPGSLWKLSMWTLEKKIWVPLLFEQEIRYFSEFPLFWLISRWSGKSGSFRIGPGEI